MGALDRHLVARSSRLKCVHGQPRDHKPGRARRPVPRHCKGHVSGKVRARSEVSFASIRPTASMEKTGNPLTFPRERAWFPSRLAPLDGAATLHPK